MGRVQEALRLVWSQLRRLSPTQQILVVSLAALVVMGLVLVGQLTARPSRIGILQGASVEQVQAAQSQLRAMRYDARIDGGELTVPVDDRYAAIAALSESGALPTDLRQTFANLTEFQSMMLSRSENTQQYLIALQNELGRVLSQMPGVRSADVLIDDPEPAGLGRASREATASVTVFTQSGEAMSQQMVNAVAGMVAGSRSSLKVNRVSVIDGSTGVYRRPRDPSTMAAGDYAEEAQRVERQYVEKFLDLLNYIPNVQVGVTVTLDLARVETQTTEYLTPGRGTVTVPESTSETSSVLNNTSNAAQPGTASNQTFDINQAQTAAGTSSEETTSTESLQTFPGSRQVRRSDTGGQTRFVATTVQIPADYVRALVEVERAVPAEGEEPAPVTRAEVEQRFAELRTDIEASLTHHLRKPDAEGNLAEGEVAVLLAHRVAMQPVSGTGTPSGVVGTLMALDTRLVEIGVLGALAACAVGMMLMLVKRSGKRPDLPSADDLVGIPPALEAEADMIGEADEGDAPMEGIEVDDEAVAGQKTLEQVQNLVREDSRQAARVLKRWIQMDDE